VNLNDVLSAQEREAEEWLLYYPERKAQLSDRRAVVLESSPKPADAGKSTKISTPTQNKALRLEDTWPEATWIDAVEYCVGQFEDHKIHLLKIRRHIIKHNLCRNTVPVGRPAWLDKAGEMYEDESGRGVHANTLSAWWRDMVVSLARIAGNRGCFK
jgi:hypothetical protein